MSKYLLMFAPVTCAGPNTACMSMSKTVPKQFRQTVHICSIILRALYVCVNVCLYVRLQMCITSMCYLPGLSALVRWKRLDGSRGLKQLSNGQLRGVVRVCVCAENNWTFMMRLLSVRGDVTDASC